jgi:hypothetical protein
MGLCITSDSVQDLFNSRAQREAEKLFSRIAVQLEKHQLAEMKGSTLVAIEQAWSGINDATARAPFGAETFYVCFTFSAYFSPDWEQTRELCYIAVSKNALDTIKRCRQAETRLAPYKVHHARALGMIEAFQRASIHSTISACLQSCSVRPVYSKIQETSGLDSIFAKHSALESVWMEPDTIRKTRDVVWDIYKPIASEGEYRPRSYLRLYSELYEQKKRIHDTRPQNSSPWMSCILEQQEHLVLCHDEDPGGFNQEQRPEWCLFWVNSDPIELSKWTSMLQMLQLELTYETSRLGVGRLWQKIPWNNSNCLGTPGLDSKVVIRNCLNALFSALAEDKQMDSRDDEESDIEYALSQLHIHSDRSIPRHTHGKPSNKVRVEDFDQESSDAQCESLNNSTGNLRSGDSSQDDGSLSDAEDELLGNITTSVGAENQGRPTCLFRPRYRPRGLLLLTRGSYRRKRNAA